MTYNVFGGTLNFTQLQLLLSNKSAVNVYSVSAHLLVTQFVLLSPAYNAVRMVYVHAIPGMLLENPGIWCFLVVKSAQKQ